MSEEQKFYQKFTQKKASKKEKSIKQHSSQICQSGTKTKTTQSKQHTFQENQNKIVVKVLTAGWSCPFKNVKIV